MAYDPYESLGIPKPTATAAPVASAKVGYDPYESMGIEKPEVGGFRAAAKQVVGSTIKGAGEVAADFIPGVSADNTLTRYGQEVIEANPTGIQGFSDIPAKPGLFVREALGNVGPSVAFAGGMRALGMGLTAAAPLTGPAAPVVAGAGQLISWGGPTLAAALPSYSGIADTQRETRPEEADSLASKALRVGGSLAVGRIEQMTGGEALIGKLMAKEGRDQLAKEVGKQTLKKTVLKEAGKSAVGEAFEEGLQSPIEQLAGYSDPTTKENLEETALGMAAGAVGGGIIGGSLGPFVHKAGQKPPDPTVEEVQSKTIANLTGLDGVKVENGLVELPVGNEQVVVPVEPLIEHFAKGGTLDTLDTAALTAPKLNELRTAVQDEENPFNYDALVALRDNPEALRQVGVNRKDVDALVEEEIARGVDPSAAWAGQERLARQANQAALERLQGADARVQAAQANTSLNESMDEQVSDYWTRLMQVPGSQSTASADNPPAGSFPPSLSDTSSAEAVVPLPTAETSAFAGQTELTPAQFIAERSADYADLFDEAERREMARAAQRISLEADAARQVAEAAEQPPPINLDRQILSRLTELEQKAQGLPGLSTPASLTMQEEQEYQALRAQASPADAQALQQYQTNVARRDALLLKQQGSQAFETVGESGQAVVVPEAAPQALTPKEQAELAQLTAATQQPPVSPYTDDSRTLAAGLPASQSDTLFSQFTPRDPTPEELAKTQVTLKGYLPNGKVGEYKINADKALAEIDADITLYEKLMECVRS